MILNEEAINLFSQKEGVLRLPLRAQASNSTLLTQKERKAKSQKPKSKEDQALIGYK